MGSIRRRGLSIVLNHVVERLLEFVVDGLALLLLPDQLVLQLVDLQVDTLHIHLTVLRPALSILPHKEF